jgi:hypothetical protein
VKDSSFSLITHDSSLITVFMLLSVGSHEHLEKFHRHFGRDERLKLPPVYFYNGRVARLLTHGFDIGAITVGRHIFVKPELTKRDVAGKWTVPAWLAAHETTHVLQYEDVGVVRFLAAYLLDYWRSLWRQKRWDAAARLDAYSAIRMECAAREAEAAYADWSEKQGWMPPQ